MAIKRIKSGKTNEMEKICNDPAHFMPAHIYLEPGLYEYTCPKCKKKTVISQSRENYWK